MSQNQPNPIATPPAIAIDDLARLRWACRRGMLELDVILVPYFDHCYAELNSEQKHNFVRFLACDDPDIFAWLMGHQPCPDPGLNSAMEAILAYNQSLLHRPDPT